MNIEQTKDGFKWDYLIFHEDKEKRSFSIEVVPCPHLANLKPKDRVGIVVSMKQTLDLFIMQKGLRMNLQGVESMCEFIDKYLSRWKLDQPVEPERV